MVLCAATQTILALWGTDPTPDHTASLHPLWALLGMEKLSMDLLFSNCDFAQVLAPLLSFLSDEFRELTCPHYLQVLRLTALAPPAVSHRG